MVERGGVAEALGFLGSELAAGLARSVEGMTGAAARVAVEQLSGSQAGSDWLWWEQPLSLSAGAIVYLGCPVSVSEAIGSRILAASGIEAADAAEKKGACFETFVQAVSVLAHAVGARLGREVSCGKGSEAGGSKAPLLVKLTLEAEGFREELYAGFAIELIQTLSPAVAPGETAVIPQTAAQAAAPRTLDLLMDVELPVSISFGRAHLPLKDVLKLSTGSIVELNRSVAEPVEVIVNNCVIARGEVVVVEGNYGVRIEQIVSKQDRLRTLS